MTAVDAHGDVYMIRILDWYFVMAAISLPNNAVSGCFVYVGVGLRVVRSAGTGNARASVFGTDTCEVLTLFAYVHRKLSYLSF